MDRARRQGVHLHQLGVDEATIGLFRDLAFRFKRRLGFHRLGQSRLHLRFRLFNLAGQDELGLESGGGQFHAGVGDDLKGLALDLTVHIELDDIEARRGPDAAPGEGRA